MTDDELLDRYKQVGEFMSTCFSDTIEVVLHDVRGDLKHSVVAIFNNHISGRTPGAPLTELAASFLKDKTYKNTTSICNYDGVTCNGVAVRASTLFIRNGKGKVIGFLCINVDVTSYTHAAGVLEKLISFGMPTPENDDAVKRLDIRENFLHTPPDIAGRIISNYCLHNGKTTDSLTSKDKYEIITKMEANGVFAFKGSIGDVAVALNLSEPTIYRHLRKIRKAN